MYTALFTAGVPYIMMDLYSMIFTSRLMYIYIYILVFVSFLTSLLDMTRIKGDTKNLDSSYSVQPYTFNR